MIVRHPAQDHHETASATSRANVQQPAVAQHARSHLELKRDAREPWLSRLDGGKSLEPDASLIDDVGEFDVAQWYRVDEAAATRGRDITECWYG